VKEEERAFEGGMRREGKDLRMIQRRWLHHKTLAQVVAYYWSAPGQRIKLQVNATRASNLRDCHSVPLTASLTAHFPYSR